MFEKMVDYIKPGVKGVAEIRHVNVSGEDSKRTSLRSFISRRDEYVAPGDYVQLNINGQLMMSDTSMEKRSNSHFVHEARGRVLIAGLGIGMVLLPILKKDEVESVIIIEKYQDVIDLVKIESPKLKILCDDIFQWKPEKGSKFDTIYFDIWPDIKTTNLEEMSKLHQRFGRYKAPDAWMESWMRETLIAKKKAATRHNSKFYV